jgi:uncharacterized protein with HEPN domain
MNRRAEKSLRDALAAADELAARVGSVPLDSYLADRDLQLITERLVIAVGEAISQAVRADETLLDTIPDALDVIGTRNRVAHGYDDIRNEVIWDVVVRNIPELRATLMEMLSDP